MPILRSIQKNRLAKPAHISDPAGRPDGVCSRLTMNVYAHPFGTPGKNSPSFVSDGIEVTQPGLLRSPRPSAAIWATVLGLSTGPPGPLPSFRIMRMNFMYSPTVEYRPWPPQSISGG